jgi:hypothetical protein
MATNDIVVLPNMESWIDLLELIRGSNGIGLTCEPRISIIEHTSHGVVSRPKYVDTNKIFITYQRHPSLFYQWRIALRNVGHQITDYIQDQRTLIDCIKTTITPKEFELATLAHKKWLDTLMITAEVIR